MSNQKVDTYASKPRRFALRLTCAGHFRRSGIKRNEMRLGLIDVLIFVVLSGVGAGLAPLPRHFFHWYPAGIAVLIGAVIPYIIIAPFLYRRFRFLPMLLPRCPCCGKRPDKYDLAPNVYPRIPMRCTNCNGVFVCWFNGKPTSEETWETPVLTLNWPYLFGRYKRTEKPEPRAQPRIPHPRRVRNPVRRDVESMKPENKCEKENGPSRLKAVGIFLVAMATVNSLLWLYLAPIMFPVACLIHLPQAVAFLVAALIVRDVRILPSRRLYLTSAILGALVGLLDLVVDFTIAAIPELTRSPYRPIIRSLISSIGALIVAWLGLHFAIWMNGKALNNASLGTAHKFADREG
jgi:hypothetical protein